MVLMLFQDMKRHNSPISPIRLYEAMKKNNRFRYVLNGKMQDAHEFLMLAAEEMGSQSHSIKWFETSFFADVRTVVQCFTCNSTYNSDSCSGNFAINVNEQSIQKALDAYFKWEIILNYYCAHCKKKVTAKKKYSLMSVPSCLFITLKRFSGSGKINRSISISAEISASNYFAQGALYNESSECRYKLVSAVNHLGQGSGSGHYTATVYSQNNDVYEIDDAIVRKTEMNGMKGHEPYLLFYERIEVICSSS